MIPCAEPEDRSQLLRFEEKFEVFKVTPAVVLGKSEHALYLRRDEVTQPHPYDFSMPETPHP
jgi:hypothetical protein